MNKDLKTAIARLEKERKDIDRALTALREVGGVQRPKTRHISEAGRRRIAAAQRKRWAKVKRARG